MLAIHQTILQRGGRQLGELEKEGLIERSRSNGSNECSTAYANKIQGFVSVVAEILAKSLIDKGTLCAGPQRGEQPQPLAYVSSIHAREENSTQTSHRVLFAKRPVRVVSLENDYCISALSSSDPEKIQQQLWEERQIIVKYWIREGEKVVGFFDDRGIEYRIDNKYVLLRAPHIAIKEYSRKEQKVAVREFCNLVKARGTSMVRPVGFVIEKGKKYVLTQYTPGSERGAEFLFSHLHSGDKENSPQWISCVMKILAIHLAHLHYNGIIHNDYYPRNVCIVTSSSLGIVSDGKQLYIQNGNYTIVPSHSSVGTPVFSYVVDGEYMEFLLKVVNGKLNEKFLQGREQELGELIYQLREEYRVSFGDEQTLRNQYHEVYLRLLFQKKEARI